MHAGFTYTYYLNTQGNAPRCNNYEGGEDERYYAYGELIWTHEPSCASKRLQHDTNSIVLNICTRPAAVIALDNVWSPVCA